MHVLRGSGAAGILQSCGTVVRIGGVAVVENQGEKQPSLALDNRKGTISIPHERMSTRDWTEKLRDEMTDNKTPNPRQQLTDNYISRLHFVGVSVLQGLRYLSSQEIRRSGIFINLALHDLRWQC